MSGIEALLKKGFKMVSNVGNDFILKVPSEFVEKYGKEVIIPKSTLEGGFGKVVRKEGVDNSKNFGKVTTKDISKEAGSTSMEEIRQASEQLQKMKEEAMPVQDINEIPNRVKDTELAIKRDKMKKLGGFAGLGAAQQAPPVDMSPLGDLKALYDQYKSAKDTVYGAAADQMDLTKDKSASEDIKNILSMVGDPMNLIPGAGGLAAGALEMGVDALPEKESKLMELLKKNKKR